MTDLLAIKDLSYKRNMHTILTDLSLTLPHNAIVGLLGANGAGKTTLMRLIAGSATEFHGEIRLNDETAASIRKSMVSFSEQLAGLNSGMKLNQIADFYDRVYPDFVRADFDKLAQQLELDLQKRLNQLSKGNQRKFTIAITFARHVQLYLLDEPFNGIDSMNRKKIIASIIQWKPEMATILISDHHVTDIANLLDQVIVVQHQTVVAQEKADTIREKHNQSIENYYESFYEGENEHD